jgi:hypothetical protein
MEFIEEEFFHDKKRIYRLRKHLIDFIGTESWWNLLKGILPR